MDSNNILYNLGLKQIDDVKKLEKEQVKNQKNKLGFSKPQFIFFLVFFQSSELYNT